MRYLKGMALRFGSVFSLVMELTLEDVMTESFRGNRLLHLERLNPTYEEAYHSAQCFGYGFIFLLFSFLMALVNVVIGDTEQASLYWILANLFFTVGASMVAIGLIRLRRIKSA